MFASDEEALAAAEEAYGKFLAAADTVLANGGIYDEQLAGLATDEVIANESKSFDTFRTNGWRLVGSSEFEMTLQRYGSDGVVAYSCDDIGGTDVVDSSGSSVVSSDRPVQVAFEVAFSLEDGHLLLANRTRWDGSGVC
ncbi:hypothetical protein [Homoserinibacter gongjuensis]|uniref:DUF4440 domain-containing protein n=1 Tax=Homoserinibacter gongjuensis TaxID=1162968 RepID=A0ABQ6JWD6_9MICO|nr:hypothetical protein [Homoserinibacter gongjuensis]GMA92017.1 hypothetical protein GCM10025869_25460 [Homoserinibacter gongjuensis]